MYEDWMLIALIVAVPLVLFLILELLAITRSRRNRALATRRKGPNAR